MQRTYQQRFPAAPRVHLQVTTGTVTVVGSAAEDGIAIDVAVRSRKPFLASQMRTIAVRTADTLDIAFEGPFVVDGRTAASVDVTLYVPATSACEVRNSLGDVVVRSLLGNLDAHTSLGYLRVGLHPDWKGDTIAASTNLGDVRMAVPPNVRLQLEPNTSLGKQRIEIPSYPGYPVARIATDLGNLAIATSH